MLECCCVLSSTVHQTLHRLVECEMGPRRRRQYLTSYLFTLCLERIAEQMNAIDSKQLMIVFVRSSSINTNTSHRRRYQYDTDGSPPRLNSLTHQPRQIITRHVQSSSSNCSHSRLIARSSINTLNASLSFRLRRLLRCRSNSHICRFMSHICLLVNNGLSHSLAMRNFPI